MFLKSVLVQMSTVSSNGFFVKIQSVPIVLIKKVKNVVPAKAKRVLHSKIDVSQRF